MFASLIFVFTVLSLMNITHAENIASSPLHQETNYCLLPPYPEHGRYSVSNHPSAMPGDRYSFVKLDISCNTGYLNNNIKTILCVNGYWSSSMPTCVRDLLGSCILSTDDLIVEYHCVSDPGSLMSSKECESIVNSGTVVTPICRSPAYFTLRALPEMHCRNGMWDYNPICKPACGLTTQHLQLEGTSSNHLELPWHAVIYGKWSKPYEQRCGGSLITDTKIISAAYCFHNNDKELRPSSDFVVAVNKMYRKYNDTRDRNSQYSDVAEIKIPSSYRGSAMYYKDDIAIAAIKTPFLFHLSVRPVCLNFDNDFDRPQLTDRNSDKTVHWSIVDDNESSEVLNVVDFSYMKNEDCDNILSTNMRRYLTKDKFCARYNNGTSLGTGNLGSGLSYLESTTQRYFLRGVRSEYTIADGRTMIESLTSIVKHEHFIKQHL